MYGPFRAIQSHLKRKLETSRRIESNSETKHNSFSTSAHAYLAFPATLMWEEDESRELPKQLRNDRKMALRKLILEEIITPVEIVDWLLGKLQNVSLKFSTRLQLAKKSDSKQHTCTCYLLDDVVYF